MVIRAERWRDRRERNVVIRAERLNEATRTNEGEL